ncbi:hypothetical protein BASA83_005723 [Batrachochytrium salamandrivorans]|nr:hypothetical protein BASA83_005723 [Batrachochytrium salamandrivorans]
MTEGLDMTAQGSSSSPTRPGEQLGEQLSSLSQKEIQSPRSGRPKRTKPEISRTNITETLVAKRRRQEATYACPAAYTTALSHSNSSRSPIAACLNNDQSAIPTRSILSIPAAMPRLGQLFKSPAQSVSSSAANTILKSDPPPLPLGRDIPTSMPFNKPQLAASRNARPRNPFIIRQDLPVGSQTNKARSPFSLLAESLTNRPCSDSTAIPKTELPPTTQEKAACASNTTSIPYANLEENNDAKATSAAAYIADKSPMDNLLRPIHTDTLATYTGIDSCNDPAESTKESIPEAVEESFSKEDTHSFYGLLSRKQNISSFQKDMKKLAQWKDAVLAPTESAHIDIQKPIVAVIDKEPKLQRQIRVRDSIPHVDSTLKTEIVVLSEYSLEWCSFENSLQESRCLSLFASSLEPSMAPCEQFMRSTFHWSYSSNSAPPVLQQLRARILSKHRQGATMLDHEQLELKIFQEHEEECLISKKPIQDDNTAPSSNGISPPFIAYISRVSDGVKIELEKEDIGWEIVETIPDIVKTAASHGRSSGSYPLDMEKDHEDGDSEDEVGADDSVVACKTHKQGRTRNLATIKICDSRSAHALFDYLLNWTDPGIEARATSLPTLFSPKPFVNAQLKRMKVLRNSLVQVAVEDSVTGQSTLQPMYKLHLSGIILPTQLQDMLSCLVEHQQRLTTLSVDLGEHAAFSVTLATHQHTTGIPPIFSSASDASLLHSVQNIKAENGWLTMK